MDWFEFDIGGIYTDNIVIRKPYFFPVREESMLEVKLNVSDCLFDLSLQKVEPWKLYLMVTGFLLVDIVILLTWQLYDPLQRRIEVFPLENPVSTEDDIKIRPELEHCESENNNVWLGKTEMILSSLYSFIIKIPDDTKNRNIKMMIV